MRHVPEKVQVIVEKVAETMGYELVGVEYLQRDKTSLLRVYIDQPEGINLEDCQAVSHQLSGVLDVEDPIAGNYNLEISSPGLDRPLFKAEDYQRFTGSQVKIKMSKTESGRKNYKGVIQGLENDEVILDMQGNEIRLALADIDQSKLVPDF
jgi:ribosome maturation factor RimP